MPSARSTNTFSATLHERRSEGQSVEDCATVRLFYENRIPELQLVNDRLNEDMERLLEEAELDEAQEKKLERFQKMIEEYNAGSLNAEEFCRQLVTFAQSLNEEEQRGLGEQLNEEELAIFDLLTKPEIEMSDTDREKVKSTARELLATLKSGKLLLDWRKRQQARAEVRVTIEKLLDQGLPRAYTPELFEQKTTAVFQHVYDAMMLGAVCMKQREERYR